MIPYKHRAVICCMCSLSFVVVLDGFHQAYQLLDTLSDFAVEPLLGYGKRLAP